MRGDTLALTPNPSPCSGRGEAYAPFSPRLTEKTPLCIITVENASSKGELPCLANNFPRQPKSAGAEP